MTEIKSVHERCFAFLCKIDDERRNEALMMAAAGHETMHERLQVAEESKGDDKFNDNHLDVDNQEENENPPSTHREDSNISSNRNLVSSLMLKSNITRTRFKKDPKIEGKKVFFNEDKKGKKVGDELAHSDDTKKRKNSDESIEEGEDDHSQSLDRDKMLKDIKISNNKLNVVTLSVILVFLTFSQYASVSV